MIRLTLTAALLLTTPLLTAQHNQLTPEEKRQGWTLLFDGRSFHGWEPHSDSFTIDDGCLKATARPHYQEDLFTAARFADFELLFDWRVSPRGNSGLKYRIQDRIWVQEQKGIKFEDQVAYSYAHRDDARPAHGQQYVVGFEYQCIDDDGHPDGRRGGSHVSGALYDFLAPSRHAAKPVGEFNHSRLVVKGSHVEHWLNGEKVVDASLADPTIAAAAAKRWGADSEVCRRLVQQSVRECPISLQNHNDEAWFRDIKIRRLR